MMRLIFPLILFLFPVWHTYAQRLVLPGDYPDPSVVKIGDTYWASATTSNWLPAYPLLKSTDLINWENAGHVFAEKPAWVDYYFWAPEISFENGKVYIYYAAHKKNGNLCLGIASADKPEGPYRDHGALMCEPAGSIDAFPMRDENGKLYLIWKEDGNSIKQPTPIWAMEMNEERTALIGEKKELFRNDAPWEANLVEGVSIIRHGEYYYAIYAGAGCCGRGCTYGTGVARAKNLLGPWEKYEKNPVLTHNEEWKCPGHGTMVEKDGRYYFLYHAYHTKGDVYAGRQGLLIEFRFTPDGWIEFIEEESPTDVQPTPTINDDFNGNDLSTNWQWSVFQDVNYQLKKGCLLLNGLPTATGAFLGQKTYGLNYDAEVEVVIKNSDASPGIGVIGDEENTVGAFVNGKILRVTEIKDNKETEIASKPISFKNKLYLRTQVRNGKDIRFFYSTDGTTFQAVNDTPVDGAFLPPWDRAVRVGILSKGNPNGQAIFEKFSLNNHKSN